MTVIQLPAQADAVAFPEPSRTWLKSTKDAWRVIVGSPLASAFLPTDLPALWMLHELMDERSRALAAYRRQRTVIGAAGQERVNGAATVALAFGVEIGNLQKAFGLTPGARAKLGLTFAQAATTTADLRKRVLDGG